MEEHVEPGAAPALSGPEPPYGEIANLLGKGLVVPFLGAGVNFGGRSGTTTWEQPTAPFLPSGAELSQFLARESSFPSRDAHDLKDLAKVSSYFVETTARRRLRERLRQVFDQRYEPCAIHTHLAGIGAPLLIVTTNYDTLMERSLEAAGRAYDLVVHVTDRKDRDASVLWRRHGDAEPIAVPPNELVVDLGQRTVVYKMHGSVDRVARRDSYVITEEDYVDFLSRMADQKAVPMQFMRHFRERHFLFLGYGLNDWNLRVILKNLRTIPPDHPSDEDEEEDDELRSWAVQFKPSDLERELWAARKVKIYDRDINEFVRELGKRRGAVA
jgi:SIR2-like protein